VNPQRRRLAAYVVFVAACAGALWRVETTANEAQQAARDAQQALRVAEAERQVGERRACESGREVRGDQERLLVDLVTQLGGGPDEIETVHRVYGNLPPLASCTP